MRRFGRYTLNALTVLSLLLCVATVGLWVHRFPGSDPRYPDWILNLFGVSDWLFAIAAGVLSTATYLFAQTLRRHLRYGHCPTCNYDLRATPDRCPECGTVPAKA